MSDEADHEIREQIAAIASRQFNESDNEYDSVDHALFVVLVNAAREYLSAYHNTEDGAWTSGDLWATIQALHENLEEESVDYPEIARTAVHPKRPTARIVRELQASKGATYWSPTGSSETVHTVLSAAQKGIIKDGMLFYHIYKKENLAYIIRCRVHRWSEKGQVQRVEWEHVSDDGTVLQGPFPSPSECARTIRGAVVNPYDTWYTESGVSFRQLLNPLKTMQ